MKSTGEIGMKIRAATLEFYRHTGNSAELERRGAGSSRPDLARVVRERKQDSPKSAEADATAGPENG